MPACLPVHAEAEHLESAQELELARNLEPSHNLLSLEA